MKKTSRLTLLSVFPKLFNGTHVDPPACDYVQCNSFSIVPQGKDQLNIDGEIIGLTPVEVTIMNKGIDLIV